MLSQLVLFPGRQDWHWQHWQFALPPTWKNPSPCPHLWSSPCHLFSLNHRAAHATISPRPFMFRCLRQNVYQHRPYIFENIYSQILPFIPKFYNYKNVTILPKQNIDHHFYLHLLLHNHLCFKTHRRNNIFTSKIQTVILQTPLPIFITAVSIQIKNLSNHSLHKTQPCTHLCFRTLWWGFWAGIQWVPVLWIGWRCPVCWWRWCCRGSSAWWKLPAALPKKHNDCIRNFWNRCDICKVVKVVHGHWWDNHCNRSDTWPSMLLELY